MTPWGWGSCARVLASSHKRLTVKDNACGTNQIEAHILVAIFVKGLCRGTVSQYLELMYYT